MPTWFAGRDQIGRFLGTRVLRQPGDFRTVSDRRQQPAGLRLLPARPRRPPPRPRRAGAHRRRRGHRAHRLVQPAWVVPGLRPAAGPARRDRHGRATPMTAGTSPLDQAISYAARSVLDVTPALLPRPTPCRGWNLDMLLRHASESLAALHDGTVTGHVALIPASPDRDPAADPARTFQDQAGCSPHGPPPPAAAGPRHRRPPAPRHRHGMHRSHRDRRARMGHIPGLRPAQADPGTAGRHPAGGRPAADPRNRPGTPCSAPCEGDSPGQPGGPARRLPRPQTPGIIASAGSPGIQPRAKCPSATVTPSSSTAVARMDDLRSAALCDSRTSDVSYSAICADCN